MNASKLSNSYGDYELGSLSDHDIVLSDEIGRQQRKSVDILANSSHGLIEATDIIKVDPSSPPTSLKRSLTYTDGLGIIVGIIIGSGIFSSPGVSLSRAGSPGAMIIAWFLSGILVFLASQCYMELAGMYPSAGGDYEYLDRAYGRHIAFSFAWFYFFISKTGSCAIISLVFARYIGYVISIISGEAIGTSQYGEESFASKAIAISIIIILSLINCLEVSESAFVSKIITSLKLLLVALLFIVALIYVTFPTSHTQQSPSYPTFNSYFTGTSDITTFSSSLIASLFCFDGWADLNFMQEELIDPRRDFVRTMLSGIAVVTIAYILVNIAYLSVLSTSDIISSSTIAIDVGHHIDTSWQSGHLFAIIFAVGVALSAAGSLNGTIMTGGRIFYAVARAGSAPQVFSKLNTAGAPWMALLSQCLWSIILLLLPGASFSVLLDYYGCMSWLYYGLVSFGVVILRYKEPLTPRPYRAWLYPIPPLLVVLLASIIMISSLKTEPVYTLFAISSVLISFPVYYIFYNR